jgi:cytochrome c peroxidase
MHNGAYATLEAVVRHYNDIPRALQTYDASQLHPLLQDTVRREPALLEELTRGVDGLAQARRNLSDTEVAELVAFLSSLTDPAARDLSHLVPARVPSGLPVGD